MRSLILLALAMAAPAVSAEALELPDYSNWYHVEVIVFAQRNAPPTDEAWPIEPIAYPDGMLHIATASDDDITPLNLGQLKVLQSLSMDPGGRRDTARSDEFLFRSRSRHAGNVMLEQAQRQSRQMPDAGTTAEDGQVAQGADAVPAETVDLSSLLATHLPAPFRAVAEEDLVLGRVAGSVNRSSRYRLLLHTAWRQPVPTASEAWPILIQTGERYDDQFEVDGTLTVSRARYLHADADLWFTQFTQIAEEAPSPAILGEIDTETLRRFPDLVRAERSRGAYLPIQTHRMNVSRRMRSGTLHYLDHPFFGVMIQVDRFSYASPVPE